MKTRSAVVMNPGGQFNLENIELPEMRDQEVLVRIVGTGMCHTDLAVRDGLLYQTPFPCVLGHEGAGIIEKVGRDVSTLQRGDQVLISFSACGKCKMCEAGHFSYCEKTLQMNYGSNGGPDVMSGSLESGTALFTQFFGQSSFSEFAIAHKTQVVKVEVGEDLKWLGPLGCSVQAGAGAVLNVGKPQRGDSIVIFGAGAVGLSALMAAKVAGCSPIIVVDNETSRLEKSLTLGADICLKPAEEGFVKSIRLATKGGAQFSIDCTGVASVLPLAVRILDRLGTCILVGAVPPKSVTQLDSSQLLSGRTIRGTTAGDSSPKIFIPILIDFWKSGRLPIQEISTLFAFEKIEEATVAMKSGTTIKPIITM